MTEPSEPDLNAPGLHLVFRSECPSKVENYSQDDPSTVFIPQESGKKSSYRLAAPINAASNVAECFVVHKPAHLVIEYRGNKNTTGKTRHAFFLGGFQMTSNSRQIEVYLSNKEGKESYLMTSRGISIGESAAADGAEYMHKAVSVVPGGPRAITRLHIKLLSLRPNDETCAKIHSIKVTARLPDVALSPGGGLTDVVKNNTPPSNEVPLPPSGGPTVTTTSIGGISSSIPVNSFAPPKSNMGPSSGSLPDGILTQSDMGAAMIGLNAMVRNMEERLENSMGVQLARLDQTMGQQNNDRWDRIEKHMMTLTGVVVSQKRVMEQQNQLVVKQQQMILEQALILNKLRDQQALIMSTMLTLQNDVQASRIQQHGHHGELQDLLEEQQQSVLGAVKVLGDIGHATNRQQQLQQQQHQQALENAFVYAMQNHEEESDNNHDRDSQDQFYAPTLAPVAEMDDDGEDEENCMYRGLEVGSNPVLSPIAEVNTWSFDTADTLEDSPKADHSPQSSETFGEFQGEEKLELEPTAEEEEPELREELRNATVVSVEPERLGNLSPCITEAPPLGEPVMLEPLGWGEDVLASLALEPANQDHRTEDTSPTVGELRDLIMLELKQAENETCLPSSVGELETKQGDVSVVAEEAAIHRNNSILDAPQTDPDEGDIPMVTESRSHSETTSIARQESLLDDSPSDAETSDVEQKKNRLAARAIEEEKKETLSPSRFTEEEISALPNKLHTGFGIETAPSDECTPRGASHILKQATDSKSGARVDPCCFAFDLLDENIEEAGLGNPSSPNNDAAGFGNPNSPNNEDVSSPSSSTELEEAKSRTVTPSCELSNTATADGDLLGLDNL